MNKENKKNSVLKNNRKKALLWFILPPLLAIILFTTAFFIDNYSHSIDDEMLVIRIRTINLLIGFLSIFFLFSIPFGIFQGVSFLKNNKKTNKIVTDN